MRARLGGGVKAIFTVYCFVLRLRAAASQLYLHNTVPLCACQQTSQIAPDGGTIGGRRIQRRASFRKVAVGPGAHHSVTRSGQRSGAEVSDRRAAVRLYASSKICSSCPLLSCQWETFPLGFFGPSEKVERRGIHTRAAIRRRVGVAGRGLRQRSRTRQATRPKKRPAKDYGTLPFALACIRL